MCHRLPDLSSAPRSRQPLSSSCVLKSVLCACVFAACTTTSKGVPTGATCPDPEQPPQTWDNFGHTFMTTYCTSCHSSQLPLPSQRNGATVYHDFDTLAGAAGPTVHIDEEAGAGPNATNTLMPPDRCPTTPGGKADRDCPKPSELERQQLATWMRCLWERRTNGEDPI
jgi:hypothetical protein